MTFPPGLLRLATRPNLTGSPPVLKTIGTVEVAALAATAAVIAGRDQRRHWNTNQLRSERRQAIVATFRPTIFDCDVAALDETSLVEARAERGQEGRIFVCR